MRQQDAGMKQIGAVMWHMKELIARMMSAAYEQREALASPTWVGEEVRRLAWQTSRTLDKQTEMLSHLAATSNSLAAGMGAMGQATSGQATLSEQLARAVEVTHGRAREIASTTAQQACGTSAIASEVLEVTARLRQLSCMQGEQIEHLDRLNGLLGDAPPQVRPAHVEPA